MKFQIFDETDKKLDLVRLALRLNAGTISVVPVDKDGDPVKNHAILGINPDGTIFKFDNEFAKRFKFEG